MRILYTNRPHVKPEGGWLGIGYWMLGTGYWVLGISQVAAAGPEGLWPGGVASYRSGFSINNHQSTILGVAGLGLES